MCIVTDPELVVIFVGCYKLIAGKSLYENKIIL